MAIAIQHLQVQSMESHHVFVAQQLAVHLLVQLALPLVVLGLQPELALQVRPEDSVVVPVASVEGQGSLEPLQRSMEQQSLLL
jgi:hypothetical protein